MLVFHVFRRDDTDDICTTLSDHRYVNETGKRQVTQNYEDTFETTFGHSEPQNISECV